MKKVKSKSKSKSKPQPPKRKTTPKNKQGKKMVDGFLLKLSPQLQKQMKNLKATVEKGPMGLADLRMLGVKILERAKNLSKSLRTDAKSRRKAK